MDFLNQIFGQSLGNILLGLIGGFFGVQFRYLNAYRKLTIKLKITRKGVFLYLWETGLCTCVGSALGYAFGFLPGLSLLAGFATPFIYKATELGLPGQLVKGYTDKITSKITAIKLDEAPAVSAPGKENKEV